MKSKSSKLALRQLVPWTLPIILIIIWQVLVKFGLLSTRVLPAPTDVLLAGVHLASSGELWRNLLISTIRAALGFLIGGSIGFALGLLNGQLADVAAKALEKKWLKWDPTYQGV